MATPTIPSSRITSTVPSARVLHAINPFVSFILRSPLHGLFSKQVMLLTYTGRKTGKQYTIPVGYTRDGATLTVFSSKSWWKNLRSDSPVTVMLQGRARTSRADVITDHAAVLAVARQLVANYGFKAAGQKIGLALNIDPPPTDDELAAALEQRVVIRLTLDT